MDRKNFESGWNRYCEKIGKRLSESKTIQEMDSRFPPKKEFKPFVPKEPEGNKWMEKLKALRAKEGVGGGNESNKIATLVKEFPEVTNSDGDSEIDRVYKVVPPYEGFDHITTSLIFDPEGREKDVLVYGTKYKDTGWNISGKPFGGIEGFKSSEEAIGSLGYSYSFTDPDSVKPEEGQKDLGSRLNQDHRKRHPELYKQFKDPNSGEDRWFEESVQDLDQEWKSYLKRGLLNESADVVNMGDYKKRKGIESTIQEAELSYEIASQLSDIAHSKFGEDSEEYNSVLDWMMEVKDEVLSLEQNYRKTYGNFNFLNRQQIAVEAKSKVPEYMKNLEWE
jgi:hypothetical protein